MRLYQFGDVVLPDDDAEDSIGVNFRDNLIELPNGGFDPDGNAAFLRPSMISRRAVVHTAVNYLDYTIEQLLAEAKKGRRILKARMRDNTERFTWAKVVSVTRDASPNRYYCEQPYVIQFKQDYPYWLFTPGENLNLEIDALPFAFNINHLGYVPAPRGQVIINPRALANIEHPRITNTTNGMYIDFVGNPTGNDVLTIDFLTKTIIYDNDGDVIDGYAYTETNPDFLDWMILEPGVNAIEVTGEDINGTVDLNWQYNHHFI